MIICYGELTRRWIWILYAGGREILWYQRHCFRRSSRYHEDDAVAVFGQRAQRKRTMRIIPERLDYMCFLGYGLDDNIPNHSVLSKARKRWSQEVFVSVFSRVVAQCVRAGLVEGTKIHADSSLVDANASLNSLRELDAATLDQIDKLAVNRLRNSTKQRPITTRRMTINTQSLPHQDRLRP